MSFKIGFTAEENHNNNNITTLNDKQVISNKPRKSVVEIYFPKRNFSCSYYNDLYDLKVGDIVYVEGKLEGLRGHVTKVNHTFKIKLSDYKRVISLVNTNVKGEFVKAGDCLITNDCNALPFEQVITWFKAPSSEDDVVSFESNESFNINNLKEMKIHPDVAQLGHEFYLDKFVVYIEIKGNKGRAIVDTSKPYEVEFNYNNGEISNLVCSCFCTDACKHQFAVMLQLKDILENIEECYKDEFNCDYIASIFGPYLFEFALDRKTKVNLKLF